MRRVLMFCYYFPPLGGIGSLRALKLATYLPESGWQPRVIAPRDGTYFRDPTLRFPESEVTRTGSIELSRAGKRMVGAPVDDFREAAVGPLLARLRDVVRRRLYFPDPQRGWTPFAFAAGRAALRERRYDAVYSTSFPISAHVAARRLANEAGLPWVAEFRDPWTDVMPPEHPQRARALALEASLVESAAAVVTPSADWARLFAGKGARRVEVVTNGVDPADVPPAAPPPVPVLTHLGTFYPESQSLAVLWPALRARRAARPEQAPRLRFVGAMEPRLAEELRTHGLAEAVEATGFLHYADAQRALVASSMLIVAGARLPRPERRGWIPAKTWEYLATDLPIVYVGHADTEVARLLRAQPGCWTVAPDDEPGAARALEAALGPARFARDVSTFSRRTLAGRMARLFDEVAR
jgi:glycosyltransferase involved in cell wall biosynthesis